MAAVGFSTTLSSLLLCPGLHISKGDNPMGEPDQLKDELDTVINRHRQENELSYSQMIGVIYLILSELADEAKENTNG